MSFSGCQKSEMEDIPSSMNIGQLKNLHKASLIHEQNEISPFWNVEQNTSFILHFNSKVEPASAVTVHTDIKCEPDSRVGQLNCAYLDGSGVYVIIKPGYPVLADKSNTASWGNAPIYYLRINYDRFSDNVSKLAEPVIVPFTVKTDVSTPTVYADINNSGQLVLSWTPVDKAESYEIFESRKTITEETPDILKTKTDAELGFIGEQLNKAGETAETSFSDINLGEDKVTYFVRAKDKKGRVSNYSIPIDAWKYKNRIPSEATLTEFKSFPELAEVTMMDGSVQHMPVNFKKGSSGNDATSYNYEIPNTTLTGVANKVNIENVENPEEYKSSISFHSGVYKVAHDESIIPSVKENSLTKLQKKALTLDKEKPITLYSKEFQKAFAEMEGARESIGYSDKTIDKLIEEQGSIYDKAETFEVSKDHPASECIEKIEEKTVSSVVENTDESKPSEDAAEAEKAKDETTSQSKESSEEAKPAETAKDKEATKSEEVKDTKEAAESEETKEPEEAAETEETSEDAQAEPEAPQEEINEDTERPANASIGEADTYPVPDVSYRIFADSAEEEYLARMLMTGIYSINIQAFPKLQNPVYLEETMQNVIIKNPYVLGVNSYSYDAEKNSININYSFSTEAIHARQKEIYANVTTFLSRCVREGMTEDEKALAIWNELEDNTKIDTEAIEAAQKKNFKGLPAKHEDSFNAYGMICKRKGTAQAYALAYKLLLVESSVNAEVVTGYFNGTMSHAWNIVYIGDKWYWFDVANNGRNSGIPYYLFENSSDVAKNLTYILDEKYYTENNESWTNQPYNEKSFYIKHGLTVDSLDKIADMITIARTLKRNNIYGVYMKEPIKDGELTPELLAKITQKLIESGIKEVELKNFKIKTAYNYLYCSE